MTTTIRRLALYKAQEGAYLSDLEQLQASISLPSTIKMVFSLRKFTKFSAGLVVAWSFYYLGSQASKREYAYATSSPAHNIPAVYITDETDTIFDWPDSLNASLIGANQKFALASEWQGLSLAAIPGTDSNLYPLIPNVNATAAAISEPADWMLTLPSKSTYTALAGRVLKIKPENAKPDEYGYIYWAPAKIVSSYTLETSYLNVVCDSITVHPIESFPSGTLYATRVSVNASNHAGRNLSTTDPARIESWTRWNST